MAFWQTNPLVSPSTYLHHDAHFKRWANVGAKPPASAAKRVGWLRSAGQSPILRLRSGQAVGPVRGKVEGMKEVRSYDRREITDWRLENASLERHPAEGVPPATTHLPSWTSTVSMTKTLVLKSGVTGKLVLSKAEGLLRSVREWRWVGRPAQRP